MVIISQTKEALISVSDDFIVREENNSIRIKTIASTQETILGYYFNRKVEEVMDELYEAISKDIDYYMPEDKNK